MMFMCSFIGHRWHQFSACHQSCGRCGAITQTPFCTEYHPQHFNESDPYP
jgi:hypothetical protein